jgi:hypothetical protein
MSLVGPVGVPLAVTITLADPIFDVDNIAMSCNNPVAFTDITGASTSLTGSLAFAVGDGPKTIYLKSPTPGTFPIHWEATSPYFVDAKGVLQKTHDSFDVTFINSPQFQFKGTLTGISAFNMATGLATLDVPSGHTVNLTWGYPGSISITAIQGGSSVGFNGPFVGPCHVDFYSTYGAGITANVTGITITANDGTTTYTTTRNMITCIPPAPYGTTFTGNPVTPSGSFSIPVTVRGFSMGASGTDVTSFSPNPGTATVNWSVSISGAAGTVSGTISGTPCVVPGGAYFYAPAAETGSLILDDDSGMAPPPGNVNSDTDLVGTLLGVFFQSIVTT